MVDNQHYKLADLSIDISYGYTASAAAEPVGPKFLRITDIQGGVVNWSLVPFCKISDNDLSKYLLEQGDIVIARTGNSTGENYIYTGNFPTVFASYLIRIKINQAIADPFFVWYQMRTPAWWNFINSYGTGSVQAGANAKIIGQFPMTMPTLTEQLRIARFLKTIDAKIELNNRINSELEALAKTLYDFWFVQFDFPDENGKPYKSSGGKMIWNETLKLYIPEGWTDAELKDIANITMGQSPPGDSYNDDNKGVVFYQGSTDFGYRFPTVRQYTTSPTRFAKECDILLSIRAPVGMLNIANEKCCIGRGLAALNSKDNCISYLFGVMINLKQIFDRRNVNGTTFGSITKDDLSSLNVIKPKKSVLNQFNKLMNPVFEKQNIIELENKNLSKLRDWLIPMLMNGQVTVT